MRMKTLNVFPGSAGGAMICRQRMIDEGWQQTMDSYYHEKSIPYCIENYEPLLSPTHTHTHAHTHT